MEQKIGRCTHVFRCFYQWEIFRILKWRYCTIKRPLIFSEYFSVVETRSSTNVRVQDRVYSWILHFREAGNDIPICHHLSTIYGYVSKLNRPKTKQKNIMYLSWNKEYHDVSILNQVIEISRTKNILCNKQLSTIRLQRAAQRAGVPRSPRSFKFSKHRILDPRRHEDEFHIRILNRSAGPQGIIPFENHESVGRTSLKKVII